MIAPFHLVPLPQALCLWDRVTIQQREGIIRLDQQFRILISRSEEALSFMFRNQRLTFLKLYRKHPSSRIIKRMTMFQMQTSIVRVKYGRTVEVRTDFLCRSWLHHLRFLKGNFIRRHSVYCLSSPFKSVRRSVERVLTNLVKCNKTMTSTSCRSRAFKLLSTWIRISNHST